MCPADTAGPLDDVRYTYFVSAFTDARCEACLKAVHIEQDDGRSRSMWAVSRGRERDTTSGRFKVRDEGSVDEGLQPSVSGEPMCLVHSASRVRGIGVVYSVGDQEVGEFKSMVFREQKGSTAHSWFPTVWVASPPSMSSTIWTDTFCAIESAFR